MNASWRRALKVAAIAALLVGPDMAPVPAEAQKLPDAIVARKKIVIALFASFPPMAYKRPEDNALAGIDVDLASYFGRKLGVDIAWQEVSYESATNALTTGRVDMALSLLDLPEPAAKLDFVDYLSSGIQVYTLAGHAPIATLADLCGQTVGANRRNGFDAAMRDWSDKNCVAVGRPALKIEATEGTPAARLELRQSRVDAIVQSSESVPYTMKLEPGAYVKVGPALSTGLMIAMAFPKEGTQLRDAVKAVLKESIADGSYATILKKFEVEGNSAADAIARQ
jgi:polar amino acid transport system substrate-binding protein